MSTEKNTLLMPLKCSCPTRRQRETIPGEPLLSPGPLGLLDLGQMLFPNTGRVGCKWWEERWEEERWGGAVGRQGGSKAGQEVCLRTLGLWSLPISTGNHGTATQGQSIVLGTASSSPCLAVSAEVPSRRRERSGLRLAVSPGRLQIRS